MRISVVAIAALVLVGSMLRPGPVYGDDPKEKVEFNRDIRPILSNNCFFCHGPDPKERKSRLRLDTKEGAFAERRGSHPIVPGDLAKSEVYRRITAKEESERMPPPSYGKTLTEAEKDLIKRWIEQGAPWQDHWAFITPVRPPVPSITNKAWVRNPIDAFILARLQKENLSPSPEADRRTLIRRVTLDLTGLPPTPKEVEAFINDKSPDAYEKLVDRLLNSPRYGEHMARFWLDSARYGDTHGMHLDNYREMWPYRDWVINAFNRNLPFDQFVIQQLAGDLLPNPTLDQLVATGFNRAHVTTNEGGSIVEEVHVRNVVDRVETTGTVFLGLTVGCAVCHDHKYDPISQKEFYQLFAFFNSLDANPMDGNAAQHPPITRVPTEAQKKQIALFDSERAQIRKEIQDHLASFKYVEPEDPATPTLPPPKEVVWIDDELPAGAQENPPNNWKWINVDAKKPVLSGKKAVGRSAKELEQHVFIGAQPLTVSAGDKLFAYVYLDPSNLPKQIMLQWNDGSWEHRAYWGANRIPWGQDKSPSRRPMGKLPKAGQWVRLEVDAKQVGLNPGAKINGWAFTQFGGTVYWDKAGIVRVGDVSEIRFDSLVKWDEFHRGLESPPLPQPIKDIVKLEPAKRNMEQQRILRNYFIEHVYYETRDVFQPLHARLAEIDNKIKELEQQQPTTLIWKERAEPKPAFVLKRGEYDKPGERVERRTPAVLPPMPDSFPRDRLGFARWLVSPEHPLTARVAVNRFWQQCFGTGIVKTSEDFGNQGDRPSHPELLDWLAVEFREGGWNIKEFMKLLVTSNTYRQSSRVTPDLLPRDPENRLLARGPRIRLDAEMLRDQAFAISGLLVDTIGGPSGKPPQPPGLWEAVAYTSSNTAKFKQDTEPSKLYRRSMYTFWKRTSSPPQMSILDAPSREMCTVRRERTNTPLQALLMMNEKQFVEAARHFAKRIIREGGKTPHERAAWAFQVATARPPSDVELNELIAAFREFEKTYAADPKSARELIQFGDSRPDASLGPVELASWTMIANVVLNLDEVIMKN